MPGIIRDDNDPQTFKVEWSVLNAGINPWKRLQAVAVDPFLVAKAIKRVMRLCPNQTATGKPLVWNEYRVFLELSEWERIKKLEATLSRDLGEVVQKELVSLKAEMVGNLNVRLLRDEGGHVRAGHAVIKADFSETEAPPLESLGEMTVRLGGLIARSVAELPTQRLSDQMVAAPSRDDLKVNWPSGATVIRGGTRVVLGRPHIGAATGFVGLDGAGNKINKRQLWIEPGPEGATIGRLSDANPVQVNGRLIQPGGEIVIDTFPAELSLSSGEMLLTVERAAVE